MDERDDPRRETPETVSEPVGEPAFLARARRILAGDVRADDYLLATDEVEQRVSRDVAFVARSGAGVNGPDPSVARRQRNDRLLAAHHGGENVACMEDEGGVIVLAVGLEQIRALLDAVPPERRAGVSLDTPEPDPEAVGSRPG